MKIIKIFLYGGISYIVLHATLFIGGPEALLYSLKKYFWLFFILDITTLYLLNNKNINLQSIINTINNKFKQKPILKHNNTQQKKNNFEKKVEKKVQFVEESEYTSDSDSEIGTDVDFEEFKQSLKM